jgi:hypothetical protein
LDPWGTRKAMYNSLYDVEKHRIQRRMEIRFSLHKLQLAMLSGEIPMDDYLHQYKKLIEELNSL